MNLRTQLERVRDKLGGLLRRVGRSVEIERRLRELGLTEMVLDRSPSGLAARLDHLERLESRLDELEIAGRVHEDDFPDVWAINHQLTHLEDRVDRLGLGALVRGDVSESTAPFLTWRPPGHFYSAIPNLDEIRFTELGLPDDGGPGLELREEEQRSWFERLAPFIADWRPPTEPDGARRYYLPNGSFDWSDGAVLQAMLRVLQPARIVEVGSGYSTALMLDTIDEHFSSKPSMVAIEPFPDVLRSRLRDSDGDLLEIVEKPVQEMDLDLIAGLEAGDVLFLDTTHVAKVGSDVVHDFRSVLPAVPPGVFVHVHDVFWPFEYPEPWYVEGRTWNELYVLEAFLRFNDRFRMVMFGNWFHRRVLPGLDGEAARMWRQSPAGGSLWLEVCSTG